MNSSVEEKLELANTLVDYKTAKFMYERGFNKLCICSYNDKEELTDPFNSVDSYFQKFSQSKGFLRNTEMVNNFIAAPIWDQFFQ